MNNCAGVSDKDDEIAAELEQAGIEVVCMSCVTLKIRTADAVFV